MSSAKRIRKTVSNRSGVRAGRPSAVDVARAAGVSLITVRRVFRDSAAVIPDTREQVLAAARAIGYNPSFHARALSTGETKTIAIVQADHHTIRGEYSAEIVCGIQHELFAAGLDILLSVVPEADSSSEWIARM